MPKESITRRKIPHELVPLAYETAKRVYANEIKLSEGIDLIVGNDRMNRNSAADLINIYKALVNGKQFERKLNTFSMDYYFARMLIENGRSFLDNPLSALQAHIDYNTTKVHARIPGMQRLHNRFAKMENISLLVLTLQDIVENLITFSNYLAATDPAIRKELHTIITLGIDFIAYQVGDGYHFAPAKFISWQNNTFFRFDKKEIHGTDSVDRLNIVLNDAPVYDQQWEDRYRSFCTKYGFPVSAAGNGKNRRKYWVWQGVLSSTLPEDSSSVLTIDERAFIEGKISQRVHLVRERDPALVSAAKKRFKQMHGRLFCQACEIDFVATYGKVGEDFIEAHHTIPVHTMPENHESKVEDMAMLCSNCHRMVHRHRPWLSMEDLPRLLVKKPTW